MSTEAAKTPRAPVKHVHYAARPQLANVSPALLWNLVRKNNAFLTRRNNGPHTEFTRELGNPLCLNRLGCSGLVNPRAIDVRRHGKFINVAVSQPGMLQLPRFRWNWTRVRRCTFNRVGRIIKRVAPAYKAQAHTPALQRAAALHFCGQRIRAEKNLRRNSLATKKQRAAARAAKSQKKAVEAPKSQ
eukprot:m51a1_g11384 putative 60S ribosomal protein L28e (187) ;mRNA; r:6516-7188